MPPPIIAILMGFWVEEEMEEGVVGPDLDPEAVDEVLLVVLKGELCPRRPFRRHILRTCSSKFRADVNIGSQARFQVYGILIKTSQESH